KIRCPETVQVADWFSLGATGSSDEDGSIVLYLWDFGDGTPASAVVARSARHRYVRAGTYTVTLTVVDNRGATATAEATVHSTSSCGCG
ncbi:MAG: PKD domain-containing protein, partial [Candidatus Bipolaricaulis sp.]|nr:PKD domain-containing protein [Candidatus Bipolaricaulis sp.]